MRVHAVYFASHNQPKNLKMLFFLHKHGLISAVEPALCNLHTLILLIAGDFSIACVKLNVDLNQARNQLGTPGGAKSCLRRAQIFWTMSNSFKIYSTNFSRRVEKFSRRASPPPGYGPDLKPQHHNVLQRKLWPSRAYKCQFKTGKHSNFLAIGTLCLQLIPLFISAVQLMVCFHAKALTCSLCGILAMRYIINCKYTVTSRRKRLNSLVVMKLVISNFRTAFPSHQELLYWYCMQVTTRNPPNLKINKVIYFIYCNEALLCGWQMTL